MLFNLIIGIVCGVAGGMNLAVGNGIVGLVNIILSFGNFFLWSYLRKKEQEERLVQMYNTNLIFKKGILNNGETKRKDEFGMESNEDWLAQLCQQSKGSNSK